MMFGGAMRLGRLHTGAIGCSMASRLQPAQRTRRRVVVARGGGDCGGGAGAGGSGGGSSGSGAGGSSGGGGAAGPAAPPPARSAGDDAGEGEGAAQAKKPRRSLNRARAFAGTPEHGSTARTKAARGAAISVLEPVSGCFHNDGRCKGCDWQCEQRGVEDLCLHWRLPYTGGSRRNSSHEYIQACSRARFSEEELLLMEQTRTAMQAAMMGVLAQPSPAEQQQQLLQQQVQAEQQQVLPSQQERPADMQALLDAAPAVVLDIDQQAYFASLARQLGLSAGQLAWCTRGERTGPMPVLVPALARSVLAVRQGHLPLTTTEQLKRLQKLDGKVPVQDIATFRQLLEKQEGPLRRRVQQWRALQQPDWFPICVVPGCTGRDDRYTHEAAAAACLDPGVAACDAHRAASQVLLPCSLLVGGECPACRCGGACCCGACHLAEKLRLAEAAAAAAAARVQATAEEADMASYSLKQAEDALLARSDELQLNSTVLWRRQAALAAAQAAEAARAAAEAARAAADDAARQSTAGPPSCNGQHLVACRYCINCGVFLPVACCFQVHDARTCDMCAARDARSYASRAAAASAARTDPAYAPGQEEVGDKGAGAAGVRAVAAAAAAAASMRTQLLLGDGERQPAVASDGVREWRPTHFYALPATTAALPATTTAALRQRSTAAAARAANE